MVRLLSDDQENAGKEGAVKGSELLHLAQLSADAAARQLVDRVPDEVRSKGTAKDLVTDCDVEAEEAARATIELHRPEDSILAEEGEEKVGSSDVRWIVDALDGTVNYVAGIEDWAVSVAAEIFGGGGGASLLLSSTPLGAARLTPPSAAPERGVTGNRSPGPGIKVSGFKTVLLRRGSLPIRTFDAHRPNSSLGSSRWFEMFAVVEPPL